MKNTFPHWLIIISIVIASLGQGYAMQMSNMDVQMQNEQCFDCTSHQQTKAEPCSESNCYMMLCNYLMNNVYSLTINNFSFAHKSKAHFLAFTPQPYFNPYLSLLIQPPIA